MATAPPVTALSIGALARAIGVPVETLRTWERRYGFPQPIRTPRGHRRYSMETLERLRAVVSALREGHSASTVMRAEPPALNVLSQTTKRPKTRRKLRADRAREEAAALLERWFALVRINDHRQLRRELTAALNQLGPQAFFEELLDPFEVSLRKSATARGLNERYASVALDSIEELLSRFARPLMTAAYGPLIAWASPLRECQDFDFTRVVMLLALNNLRVIDLGPNAKVPVLARSLREQGAQALVLSVSPEVRCAMLSAYCDEIHAELGSAFCIVAGGSGLAGPVTGATRLGSWLVLDTWARNFALQRRRDSSSGRG